MVPYVMRTVRVSDCAVRMRKPCAAQVRSRSRCALQPALFVAGLAAVEKLRAESPATADGCSAAAGLSLGEYTALVFAGAMSFEDGLKVGRKDRVLRQFWPYAGIAPDRILSVSRTTTDQMRQPNHPLLIFPQAACQCTDMPALCRHRTTAVLGA